MIWFAGAADALCQEGYTWELAGAPQVSVVEGAPSHKAISVSLRKVPGNGTCRLGIRTDEANIECYQDLPGEWRTQCDALYVDSLGSNPSNGGNPGDVRDYLFVVRPKPSSAPSDGPLYITDTDEGDVVEGEPTLIDIAAIDFVAGSVAFADGTTSTNQENGQTVTFTNGGATLMGYHFRTQTLFHGATNSSGSRDGMVAKHSTTGAFQWKRHFGGSGDFVMGDLAANSAGGIFVAFAFTGTVQAGGHTLSSSGSWDAGIAKLSSSGSVEWMRKIGGSGNDFAYTVTVAVTGDILVAGHFMGFADLGAASMNSQGQRDGFVARLSASGTFQSVTRVGGTGDMYIRKVASDLYGNVYVAGYFNGTIDFNGVASGGSVGSFGGWDAFAAKYDATGAYQWGRQFGSSSSDRGLGIVSDLWGTTHIAGEFRGTMFMRAPGGYSEFLGLVSYGGTDAFLINLSTSGVAGWRRQMGWTGNDYAYNLAVAFDGTVWVSGMFDGANQIDGLGGVFRRSRFGGDGGLPFDNGEIGLDASGETRDLYLAAYASADGRHMWSQSFGSSANGPEWAQDIATYGCTAWTTQTAPCRVAIAGTLGGTTVDVGGFSLAGATSGTAYVASFTPYE